MTDCDCKIPGGGHCPRHGIRKSAHWVALCQRRGDYWEAWEAGRGPGQPQGKGFGDRVSQVLSAVGITEKRVSKVLGRPCGCGKRREALNRLGKRLRKMLP